MEIISQFLFWAVVLATVLISGGENEFLFEDDVFGEQTVAVPTCSSVEYLTSNGTHLICRTLPDVSTVCSCPGIPGPLTPPGVPLPPAGCPVFTPPTRGAFACVNSPTLNTIYCSVFCDHRFEFSSAPRNPYFCGRDTGFVWRDYPSGVEQQSLPDCTGFRHRLRLLSPYENYLPAPCYGLSAYTTRALLEDLFGTITECRNPSTCPIEDAFIQCPRVDASAVSYSEVLNVRPIHNKK